MVQVKVQTIRRVMMPVLLKKPVLRKGAVPVPPKTLVRRLLRGPWKKRIER